MDAVSARTMQELLKKYYSSHYSLVNPSHVSEREFGFGDFESKILFRHKAFADIQELHSYLRENAPPYASYSSAYYRFPAARPMENKRSIGAEMVFDLDASDLHLSCQKEHGVSWVCENCLSSVKRETMRLIEDFLVPDFGFSKDELSINFSGNRGYHVHVYSAAVLELSPEQRREISSYISAAELDPLSIFPTLGLRGVPLRGPKPTDKGWGGKVARAFISSLNGGLPSLMELGIEKSVASALLRKRAEVILGITTGNWDILNIQKKAEFWSAVVKRIGISQSDSIDRNVTNDPSHLIRLENTIHGGSGLVAKKLSFMEFEKFRPMEDSIAFGEEPIVVNVSSAPKFFMKGLEFGPYSNQTIELPAYAAAYLVLKEKATVGEPNAYRVKKL
ncbi:MAG: DNA primase small subunit domain-containing protein [Candidatus Micrarchaeaceae archaeon]